MFEPPSDGCISASDAVRASQHLSASLTVTCPIEPLIWGFCRIPSNGGSAADAGFAEPTSVP